MGGGDINRRALYTYPISDFELHVTRNARAHLHIQSKGLNSNSDLPEANVAGEVGGMIQFHERGRESGKLNYKSAHSPFPIHEADGSSIKRPSAAVNS